MEKLLKSKLEAAKELKLLTKNIRELSPKTEYYKFNSMFDERQQIIEKINAINTEINQARAGENFIETSEMKALNKEIKEIFTEIFYTDNTIRKNISNELKEVKQKLNHPETHTNKINIKA